MLYTSLHFSLLYRVNPLRLEYADHQVITCTLHEALEQHLSATKIIRGYFEQTSAIMTRNRGALQLLGLRAAPLKRVRRGTVRA
jgi:hypothetical protein